ncbi:hypothetical protein C9374_008947 [Naegleria lovaniensis]|uniref:RGS domain-containing protein n=1 Tax=Naegleria lovaniensis TaxID=51637 RepID=A0AA88KEX5_NAELO|nr:uncharacterized protein C9374_008947 [Naegleria lovaniensis]KAG2377862.1 hypothetical protein C9374_008947 [Naegleria lovaniensis]
MHQQHSSHHHTYKVGDFLENPSSCVIKQGAFKQKNSLFSTWKVHSYMFDGHCLYRVKHHTQGVEVREIFPLNTPLNASRYDILVTQIISAEDITGKKNTIGFFFDENKQKYGNHHLGEHAAKIIAEMDELLDEKNVNSKSHETMSASERKKLLAPKFLMASSAEEKKLWMNILTQHLQQVVEMNNNSNSAQVSAILSTIEAMIDIVVVSDAFGTITAYNTQAESFFGYKKKDVIGKDIKILMPFEVAKNHDEFMQRFRKTGNKHLIGKPRALPAKLSNGQVQEVRLSLGEIPGSTDRDKYRFMAVMRRQSSSVTSSSPKSNTSSTTTSPWQTLTTQTTNHTTNPSIHNSSSIPNLSLHSSKSGPKLLSPQSSNSLHGSFMNSDHFDVIAQRLNVPYSVEEVKVSKNQHINQEIFEAHHHIYDLYKSIHSTLNKYGHSVNQSFKKDYSTLEKKFHQLEEKIKHLEISNAHMLANIQHQKKVIDFLETKTDAMYKEKHSVQVKTDMADRSHKQQFLKSPNLETLGLDPQQLVASPRSTHFLTSLSNLVKDQAEFTDVLQNDYALKYFMKFCAQELSLENVKLYLYLTRFYLPEAKKDLKKAKIMRQYVIDTFIVHGAPFEVNLSSLNRKKLLEKYYKLRDYEMEKELEEKQHMEDYIHRTFNSENTTRHSHSQHDEEDTLSDGSSENSEMELLFIDHEHSKSKISHPHHAHRSQSVSSGSDDSKSCTGEEKQLGSDHDSATTTTTTTSGSVDGDDLATIHDGCEEEEDGMDENTIIHEHSRRTTEQDDHSSQTVLASYIKQMRRKSDSFLNVSTTTTSDPSTTPSALDSNNVSNRRGGTGGTSSMERTIPNIATLIYDLEEGEKFFDDLLIQIKGVMMDTFMRFIRSEEYIEMKEEIRRVHKAEMELIQMKLNSSIKV